MSKVIFIMGPSGAGKTASMRTLPPENTFLVNTINKDLPWKGSASQYTPFKTEGEKGNAKYVSGNTVVTTKTANVLSYMNFVDKHMPHVLYMIIDDNTFLTSLELLRRKGETSWNKFNDIAENFIDIATKAKSMRDDLTIFILHHTQEVGDGVLEEKTMKAQMSGKAVENSLGGVEAQFTIVLRASKIKKDGDDEEADYVFYTRDTNSTAKSPFGMFEEKTIPNDLLLVAETVNNFYN